MSHPGQPSKVPAPAGPAQVDVSFPSDRLFAELDVPLDRPVKVASDLAQEVLRHLSANGVTVKVRIDVEAEGISKLEATLLADILNNLRTIGFTVDTQ